MRGSLRGVGSRVNRLAERLRLSSEEMSTTRLRAMTDEELYAAMIDAAKRAGGLAVLLDVGVGVGLPPEVLKDLEERWKRLEEG